MCPKGSTPTVNAPINKRNINFLCEIVGPSIKKLDTPMTTRIDVETRVAITLARLAIGNTWSMIGGLYGSVESTTSFTRIFHLCPNGKISQNSPSCPVVHIKAWKGMWTKWEFCTCPLIDNGNVEHGKIV